MDERMHLSKKYFMFIICSFFLLSSLQADIVRCAALDIGSGETKLTIADVDTDLNKIIKIHYQDYTAVELREDLAISHDGNLSKQIETKLITVLNDYKNATVNLSPQQWFGIGTSVFRNAKNGREFLDRIKTETGISLYLAAQIEEGEIGFKSAVAASGLDANQIIAWDLGSGSFQITTMNGGELAMYGAEFAFVSALEVLIKTIREQTFNPKLSPNPVNSEEISLLSSVIQNEKLPAIPSWLSSGTKEVVSFGGYTSIFATGQLATGKELYTRAEILEAIEKFAGKSDDQLSTFPEPREAVVGLALLHAVMNHCGFNKMIYKRTNGSCEGLLIIPQYWRNE